MAAKEMRGLTNFIKEIRESKSTEDEVKRVNKELAKIRQKFGDKKGMDGRDKRKYITKLIFIFLLGHDVDFGQLEAVNLLSSFKLSEKQAGYLFVSVLLNESSDLGRLVLQAIKTDLASRNELEVTLALGCLATIGGKEFAPAVIKDIQRLLVAQEAPLYVRKKAALTSLRFFRRAPEEYPHGEFNGRIAQMLSHPDLGLITSVTSLVTSLAQHDTVGFKDALPLAIAKLHRLILNPEDNDYNYHDVYAPWLSVKLLRLLQVFPLPEDKPSLDRINEALNAIVSGLSEPSTVPGAKPNAKPKPQFFNAKHAVFFEAVNLIVYYDHDPVLQRKVCTQLGELLSHKEPNMRFLSLEGLSALARTAAAHDAVQTHQSTVTKLLHTEKDTTVQKRAVDVLYEVCDKRNVTEIVGELLKFLERAEYTIREELVLKIALLAERHVSDYTWFVDIIIKLIRLAGDYVVDEVVYRVIQIIVNRQDVQDYAAKTVFEALLDPLCRETMVVVGGYVLGEFGHLIANDPNSSPQKQLELLQHHYPLMSATTRGQLLTSIVKLANLFPEIKAQVQDFLKQSNLVRNSNAEIQQRANEYLALTKVANLAVLPSVLEEMPAFPEKESSILSKLAEFKGATVTDAAIGAKKPRAKANLEMVSSVAHGGSAPAATAAPTAAMAAMTVSDAPVQPTAIVGNDAFFPKFVLADSGILYENPVMQIGVKSEFHSRIGRVSLFYGNRGTAPLTNIVTRVLHPQHPGALSLKFQPISSTIAPGVQEPQVINIECNTSFVHPPVLEVDLSFQGRPVRLALKLPITLNKFLEPVASAMSKDEFFQKWNALGAPREVRNIVEPSLPIAYDHKTVTVPKLLAFGFPSTEGIDPNPLNSVCAAILHTETQIGCLLRVEPSIELQKYRLTMRASNDAVARDLVELLSAQF